MSPDLPLEDSPLDLLRSCHEKMRMFCIGCEKLVAAVAEGDPRAAASAAIVARYFREALPRHAEDEDLSLTPRLLEVQPSLATVLAELELEHAQIVGRLPAVCADLDAIAAGHPDDPEAFAARVFALVALLRRHIEVEESTWFPWVPHLPPAEHATIRREMAERRR